MEDMQLQMTALQAKQTAPSAGSGAADAPQEE
jgi:hypothetical protein